jgi:hypothetical protein
LESVEPVLVLIRERLSDVLARLHEYNAVSDHVRLGRVGEDLIELANRVYDQLVEAKHKVLYHTLRDAGLGLWARVNEIKEREFTEDDRIYFGEVYDALRDLHDSIVTGEYYKELLKLHEARKRAVTYY